MSTIDLSGRWTLQGPGNGAGLAMVIPGDVHSALIEAGRIPDPYVGRNEADAQWVADQAWTIARSFEVTETSAAPVLDLEFVDTLATVEVNGRDVAVLDSCFRRHRLDLSGVVQPGGNDIRLRFAPVPAAAAERAARLPFPVPYAAMNNRVAHLNTVRKPQCHGGWDWGPVLMPVGVYEPPRLRLFEAARIESVLVSQRHDGVRVRLMVEVELFGHADACVPVQVTLGAFAAEGEVSVRAGTATSATLTLDTEGLDLWWPAGLGPQPLYPLTVTIPGDAVTKRIGLRSLELVTAPDAAGASMTFRVNGRDVFCRGANWVPADALPARMTDARYRLLLEEAAAANMNMIRVWGGGFYEREVFYDLCDELGLLVWQDMMFACSQYPSTPDFLAEVDREIRYQLKRLGSHASVALWCGDNEVIGSLTWYELSKNNRDKYLVNYDRLSRTIEAAVLATDASRRFWPSSPCNGTLDYGDAWHDDGSGDMHFWDVWHGSKDFEHYYSVRPRFCSEFGFQAYPTMTTIRTFAAGRDLNAMSPVMEHHQRDPAGNARIIETMMRTFRMPSGFAPMVYLSQLQQALAIDMAVRYWRSLKPHCMGALYWQLNDVWPSVSWSSLDWTASWKTLHHHARRFFAPVMLAPRRKGGVLAVTAVNDRLDAVTLDVQVRRIGLGGEEQERWDATVDALPDRAVPVMEVPAPDATDCFYVVEGRERGAAAFDLMLRSVVLPGKPKAFDLPAPAVRLEGRAGVFRLSSDAPAFYVRLEAIGFGGAFNDNSVLLLPGEVRELRFRSRDGRMPEAADVTVEHLGATF